MLSDIGHALASLLLYILFIVNKSEKNRPIITIVCSHRRTVCKNDSHVKMHLILIMYENIIILLIIIIIIIIITIIICDVVGSKNINLFAMLQNHFSQQNLLNKVLLRRERCANLSACFWKAG